MLFSQLLPRIASTRGEAAWWLHHQRKGAKMPTTDLLKTFGLSRNPFTDRTAEKTTFDPLSLYVRSDLRGFRPNETTYIFFGRRGSGKTTIRCSGCPYRRALSACVGHAVSLVLYTMRHMRHILGQCGRHVCILAQGSA